MTGAWSGRYLVGLGGTISSFAITADGDWTLTVEARSSALAFDAPSGVSGQSPDVIGYDDAAAWSATVSYDGTGTDRRDGGDRVGTAAAGQPSRPVTPPTSRCPQDPAS